MRFALCLFALCLLSGGGARAAACDPVDLEVALTPLRPIVAGSLRRFERERAQPLPESDVLLVGDSLLSEWPPALVRETFGDRIVTNYALSGDRIYNTLFRMLEPNVPSADPEVVVILTGTNSISDVAPCATVAGLTALADRVHELWPDAKAILLQIPPRGPDFLGQQETRTAVNGLLPGLATTRPWLTTVNIDDEMTCGWRGRDWLQTLRTDMPFWTYRCGNYQDDWLHFSEAGYRMLGAILFPFIAGNAAAP